MTELYYHCFSTLNELIDLGNENQQLLMLQNETQPDILYLQIIELSTGYSPAKEIRPKFSQTSGSR